jgi:serine/threonine protein kinase
MDINALLDRPTEMGEAVGPRDYIAPELEGGPTEHPQPSSDVYSLGKLLYFLLRGRNLPRERHRAAQYNLVSETEPPYVHFAYELLDRSISEDPSKRYKNASELLYALEDVMERVRHSAHVLDLSVRQPCLYCVEGTYQLRLVHEPRARRLMPPPLSAQDFWKDSTTFNQTPWMILVCDVCGNVQMFRPDLASKPPRWKNVPRVEH